MDSQQVGKTYSNLLQFDIGLEGLNLYLLALASHEIVLVMFWKEWQTVVISCSSVDCFRFLKDKQKFIAYQLCRVYHCLENNISSLIVPQSWKKSEVNCIWIHGDKMLELEPSSMLQT